MIYLHPMLLPGALFEELDRDNVNRLLVISKPPEHILSSTHTYELHRPRLRQPSVQLCSTPPTVGKTSQNNKTIVTLDPRTLKITSVERGSKDASESDAREDGNADDAEVVMRRALGPCVT